MPSLATVIEAYGTLMTAVEAPSMLPPAELKVTVFEPVSIFLTVCIIPGHDTALGIIIVIAPPAVAASASTVSFPVVYVVLPMVYVVVVILETYDNAPPWEKAVGLPELT